MNIQKPSRPGETSSQSVHFICFFRYIFTFFPLYFHQIYKSCCRNISTDFVLYSNKHKIYNVIMTSRSYHVTVFSSPLQTITQHSPRDYGCAMQWGRDCRDGTHANNEIQVVSDMASRFGRKENRLFGE